MADGQSGETVLGRTAEQQNGCAPGSTDCNGGSQSGWAGQTIKWRAVRTAKAVRPGRSADGQSGETVLRQN